MQVIFPFPLYFYEYFQNLCGQGVCQILSRISTIFMYVPGFPTSCAFERGRTLYPGSRVQVTGPFVDAYMARNIHCLPLEMSLYYVRLFFCKGWRKYLMYMTNSYDHVYVCC